MAASHGDTGPREGSVAVSQQLPRALWRKGITVEQASSAISLETIAVLWPLKKKQHRNKLSTQLNRAINPAKRGR